MPPAVIPERQRRPRRTPESLTRRFDRPFLALGALWLLLWAIEPFVGSFADTWLEAVEALIWGAFAGELVARVAVARPRLAYARRHWWEIGVVAIPGLRLLRLGRLIGEKNGGSAEARLAQRLTTVVLVGVVLTVVSGRLMFDFGDVRPYTTAVHDATLGAIGGQTFTHRSGLAQALEVVLVAFHTLVVAALAGSIGAFFLRKSQDVRAGA